MVAAFRVCVRVKVLGSSHQPKSPNPFNLQYFRWTWNSAFEPPAAPPVPPQQAPLEAVPDDPLEPQVRGDAHHHSRGS
jgi:hypothetical protein